MDSIQSANLLNWFQLGVGITFSRSSGYRISIFCVPWSIRLDTLSSKSHWPDEPKWAMLPSLRPTNCLLTIAHGHWIVCWEINVHDLNLSHPLNQLCQFHVYLFPGCIETIWSEVLNSTCIEFTFFCWWFSRLSYVIRWRSNAARYLKLFLMNGISWINQFLNISSDSSLVSSFVCLFVFFKSVPKSDWIDKRIRVSYKTFDWSDINSSSDCLLRYESKS